MNDEDFEEAVRNDHRPGGSWFFGGRNGQLAVKLLKLNTKMGVLPHFLCLIYLVRG